MERRGVERQGPSLEERGSADVHDHREHGVVAGDAENIDDARLAELGDGFRVGWIAHALVGEEFREEVIENCFVLRHGLAMIAHTFAGTTLRSALGFESERAVFNRFRARRRREREVATAVDVPDSDCDPRSERVTKCDVERRVRRAR